MAAGAWWSALGPWLRRRSRACWRRLQPCAWSRRRLRRGYADAQRRGVLCNAVDEPERCDFYFPAVVRRGELQIAISTGGLSPALAQRLRKELEQQFGPEWEQWVT